MCSNLVNAWGAKLFVVGLLFACGIAGCATMKTGATGKKTVWELRDQFVKIERQDAPAGGSAPANAHPADVSVDRLRNILQSIQVRFRDEDKAVQLFNEEEINILSEKIHGGLLSAGPDEDVTFAVIGHYVALLGIFKEPMVTTGRVFCQDGEFNIIFGDVHRSVKENEDRRLHPFLPGSRGAAPTSDWRVSTKAGGETALAKRPDWLIFPIAGPTAPAVVPAPRRETGGTGTGMPPAVSPEKPAPAGRKSLEERLIILNDLRSKKLITEEEYRAKRTEILNEL